MAVITYYPYMHIDGDLIYYTLESKMILRPLFNESGAVNKLDIFTYEAHI